MWKITDKFFTWLDQDWVFDLLFPVTLGIFAVILVIDGVMIFSGH